MLALPVKQPPSTCDCSHAALETIVHEIARMIRKMERRRLTCNPDEHTAACAVNQGAACPHLRRKVDSWSFATIALQYQADAHCCCIGYIL